MNRKIAISIISVLMISILYTVFQKSRVAIEKVKPQKKIVEIESNKIPLFEFKNWDGSTFSKNNLSKEKSIIIVYFDPQCGLCEKSGQLFNRFYKIHNDSEVLFVTSNTHEITLNYVERFGLDTIANIRFY